MKYVWVVVVGLLVAWVLMACNGSVGLQPEAGSAGLQPEPPEPESVAAEERLVVVFVGSVEVGSVEALRGDELSRDGRLLRGARANSQTILKPDALGVTEGDSFRLLVYFSEQLTSGSCRITLTDSAGHPMADVHAQFSSHHNPILAITPWIEAVDDDPQPSSRHITGRLEDCNLPQGYTAVIGNPRTARVVVYDRPSGGQVARTPQPPVAPGSNNACSRFAAAVLRDGSASYSGQCHDDPWTFWTLDTTSRGVRGSITIRPIANSVLICGHNNAHANLLPRGVCRDGWTHEWAAVILAR